MAIPPFYYAPVPSSVLHDPMAYAISIFGLLGSNLLAVEWLRQVLLRTKRYPHELRHPVTINRLGQVAILVGILLRSGPDVLQITLWPDISPATRFGIAHWNRLLDGASFVPMAAAFAIAATMSTLDEAQIGREPVPVELFPSNGEKRRVALACLLLLFISVVIAFR